MGSDSHHPERRRDRRDPVHTPAQAYELDAHNIPHEMPNASVVDLGRGGLRLRCGRAIELESQVIVMVDLDGIRRVFTGVAMSVTESPGSYEVGLAFINLSHLLDVDQVLVENGFAAP